MPQIKLQENVDYLGLSITLRMKIGEEVKLETYKLEPLHLNSPYKVSLSITHDGMRQTLILHHMLEKKRWLTR